MDLSVWRRSKRSDIVGYVDHAGGGLIRGWAADLRWPATRLALDVFRHGVFLGCARAGSLRPDLLVQGIGDGFYGFVFHSSALDEPDASDGLTVVAPDPARTNLIVTDQVPAAQAGIRADDPVAELREMLRPFVESLVRQPPASASVLWSDSADRRLATLLAPEPENGSSAFAAHVAAKYRRPSAADEPAAFWRWYLDVYGIEQQGRVPLSTEDIAALKAVGISPNGTGRHQRFDTRLGRSAAFDWAVHEARRLKIEDRLVESGVERALASVPWSGQRSRFPLSIFMRTLRSRHAVLRRLSVKTEAQRTTFYAVLMILALREAHYLRYMPSSWIERMLAAAPHACLFERAQKRMFGRSSHVLSSLRYRELVGFADVDWAPRRPPVSPSRVGAGANGSTMDPVVDVQLIGPFRQCLGLAESCRRVARALVASGLDVHFVDYRIGSTSRASVPELAVGSARAARINILHLNAEEVPEAMAYCPAARSGLHTILIPYWELDRPSAVHHLGQSLVDEVWATSRFLAEVFAGGRPVVYIGMAYDDRIGLRERRRSPGFTVLTISDALSWTQRKNVLGAIEAFQSAFADADARLVVKTRNVKAALCAAQADDWRRIIARCEGDRRIRVLDEDLRPIEQRALLADADCLLSLHRAEGLGLDILDALYLGTPVVATAFSGNMDVCNDQTAWLVDYDRVAVPPDSYVFVEPGHTWAEPRIASAVAALRAVRSDAAERERRIAAARTYVQEHASPGALAARLLCCLRQHLEQRAA